MRISEMLAWLPPIEKEAAAAYRAAAKHFAGNPKLVHFLNCLAEDEDLHTLLLERASELIAKTGVDSDANVLVNPEVQARILQSLQEMRNRAQTKALTEEETLQMIVHAEFSEWNGIFLYVIAQFRESAPSFQHVASVIQQHEQRIEDYIATLPEDRRLPLAQQLPPRVWDRRILLVDDEEGLRVGLKFFLSKFGKVITASNGQEALDYAHQEFFDVIVSDVDMPVMSGLEFYRALTAGESREEIQQLCAQGRVRMIAKPFLLETVEEAVLAVLDKGA